jgi:transposase-like protein
MERATSSDLDGIAEPGFPCCLALLCELRPQSLFTRAVEQLDRTDCRNLERVTDSLRGRFMHTCPRCRSSMIVDYDALDEGHTPVWKCLGCGRSIYLDRARQAEDERLQQRIKRMLQGHPGSQSP